MSAKEGTLVRTAVSAVALAFALYVVWFQVAAVLVIRSNGEPVSLSRILGWNTFLFRPGLEVPTAMQAGSAALAVITVAAIACWRAVSRRRKVASGA